MTTVVPTFYKPSKEQCESTHRPHLRYTNLQRLFEITANKRCNKYLKQTKKPHKNSDRVPLSTKGLKPCLKELGNH